MPDPTDKTHSGSNQTVSRRDALKGISSAAIAVPLGSSLFHLQPDSSLIVNEHAPTTQLGRTIPTTRSMQTFRAGQFLLDISKTSIRVRHEGDRTRSLWQSTPNQPLIETAIGDATFREHGDPLGSFAVTDKISSLHSFRSFDSVEVLDPLRIGVTGTLTGLQQSRQFRFVFDAVSANQLRFVLDVQSGYNRQYNRIFLKYASSADEAFFGFGQQLTYFNQKGNVIPILVQEHGIGRGLPIFTQLVDLLADGAGGNPFLTEAPAPQ